MRILLQDLRYAVRTLLKNPGFTVVAVLTLSLGIGGNTAIFSVIEAVLLRSLPYKDPSKLVLVADRQDPEGGGFLYKDFANFKLQSRSFEHLAIYYRDSGIARVTLTTAGEPESVQGAFVSADFFATMGIPPLLGRAFTADEEQREEHVVLLNHGLWLRSFGGLPDVIGKNLRVNGAECKIIGVMPATFHFPAKDEQFWAPITTNIYWHDPALTTRIDPRNTHTFFGRWVIVGRLKNGASLQQAQKETDTIFARVTLADPDENRVAPGILPIGVNLRPGTQLGLFVLLGAVSLVLLIACSNVANLVLARGASRVREMAVRAALGASRTRLARQLFTESALLALMAGVLALFLASTGIRALIIFGPPDIPRLDEARIDFGVLLYTLGTSLFAAIIFGLIPAWRISQNDPHEALKTGKSGAPSSARLARTRSLLVIAELALAIVLVTGAGLLVRSFLAVQAVDLGFEPQHVITLRITTPADFTPERKIASYQEMLERAAALPNVQAVGAISGLFELNDARKLGLRAVEGHAPERTESWTPLIWKLVSGNYFQAMGAPLLRGRYFSEQDGPGSPLVAVIDESAAKRYWPGEDPIGKRFKGQDPRGHNDDWLTVIGVVGDMRRNGLEREPFPHVFEWYRQEPASTPPDLVVRTTSEPRMLSPMLRAAIRAVDPGVILSPVTTLDEQLADQLASRRFQTSVLGLFSVIALLLATVGVFALMHFAVAQRTHEIGVRIALGAQRRSVMGMVLGEGLRLALAGITIGVLAALALTRFLSTLLFGVGATDPTTFGGVALLLMTAALAGCYLPARHATSIDPMIALRYE